MLAFRRKIAVAALSAAAVLGGVAMPQTASADGVASTQFELCNDSPVQIKFWVKGYNQFNDWDDSPIWTVNSHTCATGWDYWWKQNSSVELHYKRGNAGWNWKPVYVPRTKSSKATFRLS